MHIYICIYVLVYIYICECILMYLYTYIHTCTSIQHTNILINTITHTQTWSVVERQTQLHPTHDTSYTYHTHERITSHIHIHETDQTNTWAMPHNTHRIHNRGVWQIPLQMLHPPSPPNPESQIPRYKFKSNQHLNLNLYREIPRNLRFSKWRISDMLHSQLKHSK